MMSIHVNELYGYKNHYHKTNLNITNYNLDSYSNSTFDNSSFVDNLYENKYFNLNKNLNFLEKLNNENYTNYFDSFNLDGNQSINNNLDLSIIENNNKIDIIDSNSENKVYYLNLFDFNWSWLDCINTIMIGSNTVILCFWVHSKYELKGSTDTSSSIVKSSNIIVLVFYIITIIVGWLYFYDAKIEEIEEFILFDDNKYFTIELDSIIFFKHVYKLVNSFSLLLMNNFYFMVIKEVVLRKHIVKYFRGY